MVIRKPSKGKPKHKPSGTFHIRKQAATKQPKMVRNGGNLPGDVLQTEAIQVKNAVLTAKQILTVRNVARQSQLEDGSGPGAYRLLVPVLGAYKNSSSGDVRVDPRGTLFDLKQVKIRVKNRFSEDIEIRGNTPFSYELGGKATNARSEMRSIVIKPNEVATLKSHVNIHNTLRFPPKAHQEFETDVEGVAVKTTINTLAALDYVVIIPSKPQTTGPKDSTNTEPSDYSPDADVAEIQLIAKIKVQLGVVVEGRMEAIKGPALIHTALPRVNDILYVDEQELIPNTASINASTAMKALKSFDEAEQKAYQPNWYNVREGTHFWIKAEITQENRVKLVECDADGSNTADLALREIEDPNIRVVGAPVIQGNGDQLDPISVHDEYRFNEGRREWILQRGDEDFIVDTQILASTHPWARRTRPLMYYSVREESKKIRSEGKDFWGDVEGVITGTLYYLERGLEIASLVGLL